MFKSVIVCIKIVEATTWEVEKTGTTTPTKAYYEILLMDLLEAMGSRGIPATAKVSSSRVPATARLPSSRVSSTRWLSSPRRLSSSGWIPSRRSWRPWFSFRNLRN